jgi:pheromone shutdown protein TraB
VVRAEAAYAFACLGRLRSLLDGRWFVSLCKVILAASHWHSLRGVLVAASGAPFILLGRLVPPLARTAVVCISRHKTNQPTTGDLCTLNRVTEVAREFIVRR